MVYAVKLSNIQTEYSNEKVALVNCVDQRCPSSSVGRELYDMRKVLDLILGLDAFSLTLEIPARMISLSLCMI